MFCRVLKQFKTSTYLTATIRSMVSDFAVILALIAMTAVDFLLQVDTPKLNVPTSGVIEPSWKERGWIVDPFNGNPWWTCLAAAIPAVLATILVFMDHQITVVIVNRKENKHRVSLLQYILVLRYSKVEWLN